MIRLDTPAARSGATHALVLVALRFALVGFRLGRDSNILDVGYAGVVGADLLLKCSQPYGKMPTYRDGLRRPLRQRRSDGYVQSTSGRSASRCFER